jgi:hypothetical protein
MIFTLALLLAPPQEPAEWEKFAPGSWVEHQTTGTRDGTVVRAVEKSTLTGANDKEVVISMETVDAGGGKSTVDLRYPAVLREVPKDDMGNKTGEEKLTLDGRSFTCEIRERYGVKRWICADAPANRGVLKSEAIRGSSQVLMRVLKLEEKVTVGSATLTCWVREEVTDTGDQKTTRKFWISDVIPGGIVRSEVRQVRGTDVAVETVTTLKAYHVVKKE